MAKFPEPPAAAALAKVAPDRAQLRAGTTLWRIYFQGGPFPAAWTTFRDFGPTNSRFDHHLEPPSVQSRGILYASRRVLTCFAEVFQDGRTIDRSRREPWLVAFDLAVPVTLLDLTGSWPTKARASMAINSGPRARARRWSRAIYDAYPAIEGLLYASSMDGNQPAVALYERADALPARPVFHRALADAAMTSVVAEAAAEFNFAVV